MSFQLTINEHKRLVAEIEIILEDGSTIFRRIPANGRMVIHFDEVIPCESASTEAKQS